MQDLLITLVQMADVNALACRDNVYILPQGGAGKDAVKTFVFLHETTALCTTQG